MHTLGAALLPPVLVYLFRFPRTRRTALWSVGSFLIWSVVVELVQGFLPYRNLELTDILANVLGSTLALGALKLAAVRQRTQEPS